MIELMLSTENGRTLVSCSAGKDRTGFVVAVILMVLKVPRKLIMADYLATAEYINPKKMFQWINSTSGGDLNYGSLRPLLEVHPEYMQAAFDAIDEAYASTEQYLEEHLGITKEMCHRLREMYLL